MSSSQLVYIATILKCNAYKNTINKIPTLFGGHLISMNIRGRKNEGSLLSTLSRVLEGSLRCIRDPVDTLEE